MWVSHLTIWLILNYVILCFWFMPSFSTNMSTYTSNNTQMRNLGGSLTSHISAHTSQTVAAPFRAWPGSPASVARGPIRLPLRALVGAGRIISTFALLFKGLSKKKVRLHTSYTIATYLAVLVRINCSLTALLYYEAVSYTHLTLQTKA